MAPSSIPVSSVLLGLIVICAMNTAAEDGPCPAYASRTAREVIPPLMKGLNETIVDVLYLELSNCKLEVPLSNFPSHADYVTLTNITFGDQISWEDVLPLNITRELQIRDSVFEDEGVLRKLSINNIAVLAIVNSGLTTLPMFTVSDECGTKKANFSSNAIRIVSAEAFKALYSSCNLLEDLDLSRNLIRKFPEFRAQNVYKCKLHLDNNPLSCTENDHLTLNQRARDMLIRTPHCEKDGKLVQFWFHDSPICSKCHCYIHSDIYVNCSERGLTRLPAGLPRETIHLDVSGNQLTSLRVPEGSPWREYHTVKHLNASRNPITRIDDYAPTLCNLMMLDVSYASLENLPESLVDSLLNSTGCVPLLSVGRLLLGNNPWRCDCDLLPFKRFIGERAREIVDFFSILCGLDGIEVYRVQEETLCPPPFYELNPWDVAIVVMSILIILIIYKTVRDYRLQKKTGKLPKFFQFETRSLGPSDREPSRFLGVMASSVSGPIKRIALYIRQRSFEYNPIKPRYASR